MYGRCLKYYKAKRTSKFWDGKSFAEAALFGQKFVFLSFGMFQSISLRVLACNKFVNLYIVIQSPLSSSCTSSDPFCHFSCIWRKLKWLKPKCCTCLLASWRGLVCFAWYLWTLLVTKEQVQGSRLIKLKRFALSKWYCELYAIYGIVLCTMLQRSK